MWVIVAWIAGLYRLRIRWGLGADARDIARATLLGAAVTLALLFALNQDEVSRLFLGALFVAQPLVTLAGRATLRAWFEGQRRRGRDTNYMLVVGTGHLAQSFADRVEAHRARGMKVVGHVSVPHRNGGDEARMTRPVLGPVSELPSIFRERVIDEVAVCLPSGSSHFLDPVIALAAEEGKTVRVPRDPDEGVLSTALQEDFDGFLVSSIVHDGHREVERALKRVLDVIGAVVALVVLSPLFIGTALAIRLADGSPILFRQTRIGRHGRPFAIYKFRTMVSDAEERFSEVASLSHTRGAAFKMDDDPRVTRVGRTIRHWTLDELPQLFNVLKGDMSLVGPRPAPPREVDEYDIWHRRRLSVRPGMTGLWQVEARFDEHFDDRAELDLRYIDQWSLWMDIGILLRTVPAVLTPRGR
jgi:exopolysaccharide biosynthesis polyprenyl glycosylphosphotransferase